jgi:hypothetical protein
LTPPPNPPPTPIPPILPFPPPPGPAWAGESDAAAAIAAAAATSKNFFMAVTPWVRLQYRSPLGRNGWSIDRIKIHMRPFHGISADPGIGIASV